MISVFIIVFLTLFFFITPWIRYDLVALISLISIVALGKVEPDRAFIGFSDPAVITVAAILVITEAITRSGFALIVARSLKWTKGFLWLQISLLCMAVGVLSGIMNDVGALSLMMPVAVRLAYRSGYPVSYYLIPLAYSSILGGLYTLIGTPPNLIISSFKEKATGEAFRIFDFFPVGSVVMLAGVLFLSLIGWRLLPRREEKESRTRHPLNIENYLTELSVGEQSSLIGESLGRLLEKYDDMTVVALVREGKKDFHPSRLTILRPGDRIMVELNREDLEEVLSDPQLKLTKQSDREKEEDLDLKESGYSLVEAIVTSTSNLNGKALSEMPPIKDFTVLAIARYGKKIVTRISKTKLMAGDLLLLMAPHSKVGEIIDKYDFLNVREEEMKPKVSISRMATAMGLFVAAISLAIFNIVPIQVATVSCAVSLVLLKFINIYEAYKSIDWGVIILLGALFPLGEALDRSGGASWVAGQILNLSQDGSIHLTLGILILGTMLLSNVINNAAAAVLMAPIALSVAQDLQISPDPLLIGLSVAASSAFMTPIGHQSNTLVLETGGYRFLDYTRVGLPLSIIILVVSVWLIPLVWL